MQANSPFHADDVPALPIAADLWEAVTSHLGLSPQLSRVAEGVVRGLCDKQIADALGIKESTLRTHFDRIFMRTGARGRIAIMRKILAVSHKVRAAKP